jgi:hypothetical protein
MTERETKAMASKRRRPTEGEQEVVDVVLKELRKAMRSREHVFLYIHLDPWIPKGMRGLTIVATTDTNCRRYEVENAR